MAAKLGDDKLARENSNSPSAVQIPIYNDVERDESPDLSFAAIIKGTAANPLNTFEKKAALINAELDKFGLGKYQICIWFLCGFGYFLDLAWAQGVGLIASAVYQEMNVADKDTGTIFACANAGLAIGALGFGLMVDIIGRKWAFNLTCLITSIFGLLLAAPKFNYAAICGIYFLASLGLGGNIPIDATIALEFLPQSRRFLVSLLSMWQPIGVVIASAIAYGTAAKWRCDVDLPSCKAVGPGEACCTVKSNMGWRYEVIVLGFMTLTVFFLRFFVFRFYESPKFLLSRGREAEAIEVLHKIAKFNKAPPPTLTLEMFDAIDELDSQTGSANMGAAGPQSTAATTKTVVMSFGREVARLKGIFTNKLSCFIFVLLAIAYMGDYWSFNLAGAFLPIILLRNNVDNGRGSVSDTYQQYIIIYTPGILGAVLALVSVQMPLVGRKWSLVLSAVCQGFSMAMYTQVKTTPGYVGLNALEYIMQTYFNAVLYASAPELFDTSYRGSVSGMLSCTGRLAGIVAPYAGAQFLAAKSSGILWLGAGGIWLSALVMVFLPVEMRNRQMF
ncbi:MFS general substrate transporter [Cucurbitaria berberidis CBS 394.84]|uniref:MFS general substrate transporter n=1 Tax=Cucurbitaria berberidis CBS 394.84 TaxID=1168544 RepID=A0A9P4GHX3_9PLEO|nr:MFS general substrate transporter [Cucurbitaria berberidis CBS 394.84]KAF1846478.1 MFS general substrate transporter [Cucurbitaria berberidis CBS 394.84]